MKLLFTYHPTKIGSRLIRWALGEPVSHVAVEFDSGLVIHSTWSGVELTWHTTFRSDHCIPYVLEMGPGTDEPRILETLLTIYLGQSYDYRAFIYFGWRALLLRVLGIPLPSRNIWNENRKFLCTELAAACLGREINPMISPYGLYKELLAHSAPTDDLAEDL
jgi:hypothetical protein